MKNEVYIWQKRSPFVLGIPSLLHCITFKLHIDCHLKSLFNFFAQISSLFAVVICLVMLRNSVLFMFMEVIIIITYIIIDRCSFEWEYGYVSLNNTNIEMFHLKWLPVDCWIRRPLQCLRGYASHQPSQRRLHFFLSLCRLKRECM